MVFSIDCPNKGCGQMQAPYLDKDTNKVYCSKCNREIENVSIFVKNSMRQNKQFRVKEKKSFSVKCASCQFEDRPVLTNDKLLCSACGKEHQITAQFAQMLKEKLKEL